MSVSKLWHNLVTSNLDIPEDSLTLKKIRLINFIILLAVPINLIFIYVNYVTDQKIFAFFNILIVMVMSLVFFYLRRSQEHVNLASHGTLLGIFLVHAPSLLQGGIANSGFLWFFLFPLFAVFLAGRRLGLLWIAALVLTIAMTYLFQDLFILPYEPIFLIFLIIVLLVETAYVIFSHNIQKRYETLLAQKNERLKHLTQNLQAEVNEQIVLMRAKDKQLEQQAKMASVGEMMSFISHQWKQPISVISALVQNLQISLEFEEQKEDADIVAVYDNILEQTELMMTTMKDFLNLSNSKVINQRFSVKHAIDMVATLVSPSFVSRYIDLVVDDENDHFLHGKENELIHALMNIVNNARDIILERDIQQAKVSVSLSSNDDYITIKVEDNAGGIDDAVMAKIFDPYFSTRMKSGGTGLGLHMSKKIIEEHFNGYIEVHNGEAGAHFVIYLKRYEDEHA